MNHQEQQVNVRLASILPSGPPQSEMEQLEVAIKTLLQRWGEHVCAIEPILLRNTPAPGCEEYSTDSPVLSPLLEKLRDCRMSIEGLACDIPEVTNRVRL